MLILASTSARRREMFARLGLDFQALDAGVDEHVDTFASPADYVLTLAKRKAAAVIGRFSPADLVVAADTVVSCDGVIFGKPRDAADAHAMLAKLSGRGHEVLTAFAIGHGGALFAEAVTTEVFFRPLSAEEIDGYIRREAPFDKAGGYGIQESAGFFVSRMSGSFDNVVGLPLAQLELALRRVFGLSLLDYQKKA